MSVRPSTVAVGLTLVLALSGLQALSPAAQAGSKSKGKAKGQTMSQEERVARGQYIVSTAGCHDCHTPWVMGPEGPGPDMTRALSGHPADMQLPPPPEPVGPWIVSTAATNTAFAGPWGVSYSANLTPDEATGTGSWDTETFIATIRNGRHMGRGRPLLPPMPWPVYSNLTDEDLASVFAYIQSLPEISNDVPEPVSPPSEGDAEASAG